MTAPLRNLVRTMAATALVWLVGCGGGELRIGTKAFAEQEILGEIVETLLEEQGLHVRPPLRCPDSYSCQRALADEKIDLMVEYTGTALHFVGEPAPPSELDPALARLREFYSPMGVQWQTPLGFENGYSWLVAPSNGTPATQMSELAKQDAPVRVATPPEYVKRPRDGLAATADHYGIKLARAPLVIADPLERYQAVATGLADVAVGYTTDIDPSVVGLVALEDDLAFFPDYHAVVLVRDDALARVPGLEQVLTRLENTIDDETMRSLNRAVELEGTSADIVARRFIHEAGLSTLEQDLGPRAEITVASASASLSAMSGTATLTALRELYPDQSTTLILDGEPLDAVASGRARFALVTADAFFVDTRKQTNVRRNDVEAVAVVGRAFVHRLAKNDPSGARLGISKSGGDAAAAAAALVGGDITTYDDDTQALAALGEGSIDQAFLVAPLGDPGLVEAVAAGTAVLPIEPGSDATWQLEHPYARPARIPTGMYGDNAEPIPTLSTQVVLAATSRDPTLPSAIGGPAAAVDVAGAHLSAEQLTRLETALGSTEAPDPSLPSRFGLGGAGTPEAERPLIDAILNALAIGFLGWLFIIVVAPARKTAA